MKKIPQAIMTSRRVKAVTRAWFSHFALRASQFIFIASSPAVWIGFD